MKKTLLAACASIFAFAAFAVPKLPKDYYWAKLDNGLEVVVIENHRVPLATIEIAVKNGAYTEGPEYSGLSHLFEHMFFKANRDYPDQEQFLKRTQELGAIWNGTTGNERVNYFFTFNKDSLQPGLQFMNAAIRFPIYKKEDMEKERPVVDGEFQRNESDPGTQLYFAVGKKLWGDLYTRKNPIGEHEIINTATPEKMMIIKNKYYHPNNSLLIICGDVDHASVMQQVQSVFGSWANSGFDPHEKYPIPEFKPLTKTDYFIQESSISQTPQMQYEWQGPDTRNDSAATIAADVFSYILFLNSSKWQQALVDKGLATSVYFGYQTLKYTGSIAAYVTPNPKKVKECHAEVLKQINMFADDDYFTDEQLANAVESMKRSKIRQEEKPSSLPMQLSYWWCSASIDYYTNYLDACSKVTRADIQQYIRKYVIGKPYVAGMILNADANKTIQPATFFKSNN